MTSPLRRQLHPQREQCSVGEKVQIRSPKSDLPRMRRDKNKKKRSQRNQRWLTPRYSGKFLQPKNISLIRFLFFDSPRWELVRSETWSKKSSSQPPQARREEKKSSELKQRQKKLEDWIGFLFVNSRRKKKEALDALCVFSFVLRQSFMSGPLLQLGAWRRSTYKRIDTDVLHLR